MKRIIITTFSLFALVSIFSVGCPSSQPPILGSIRNLHFQVSAASGLPTQILWDYDYSQPLNKPCTTTVTTNCVAGFSVSVLQGSTVVGPVQLSATPATQAATLTTGIAVPYNGPASLGTYSIQVQTMYKDATGTQQGGPVAAGPLVLTPSAAINPRAQ